MDQSSPYCGIIYQYEMSHLSHQVQQTAAERGEFYQTIREPCVTAYGQTYRTPLVHSLGGKAFSRGISRYKIGRSDIGMCNVRQKSIESRQGSSRLLPQPAIGVRNHSPR